MRRIVWDDRYKLGIDFIDKDHKLLFSTMNKLLKLSEDEEKSVWVCREGVKFLKNHALEHFEREEVYMREIEYEDYEIHKRLHDNFRENTLPALGSEMEEMKYSTESIRHFLGVCIGWIISHTLTEDMAIAGKTSNKWVNMPEEQEATEQAIIHLIQDLFHMKAKIISEHYDGEEFGKVVCCRFIYRGQEKKKWEIVLVYEEQLLLKIMGEILNMEYFRIDDLAINVSRYISRQFIEKLKEGFQVAGLFELEKESLVTHEQLLDAFERERPYCSLLFDTGAGYFAFCAITADSMRGKIEPSINHDNAIDMINQYLDRENEEWEHMKKRILIVDDSSFVRKNMIRLLGDDYCMLEADSSVSAIHSIVVNRPDLVLLDYEMPICDGRQTLQMIRSEKTMADIPVMFLTGRRDIETVRKVMELKPEGYLLKTTPEEEIKKIIDDFFGR